MSSLSYICLRVFPKRIFACFIGKLSKIEKPRLFVRLLVKGFAFLVGADAEASAKPISEFRSLREFFLRELKSGLRPLGKVPVSPVDGELAGTGPMGTGDELPIKGDTYSLEELFAPFSIDAKADANWYHFYLSPKDYHRVHAPCDMKVTHVARVAGELFPVAPWALVPQVLARNERVVLRFETDQGPGLMSFVAALAVGNIGLSFFEEGFPLRAGEFSSFALSSPAEVKVGEDLGSFALGSSIVLLLPGASGLAAQTGQVRYGQALHRGS